jgi:hypothetical protein
LARAPIQNQQFFLALRLLAERDLARPRLRFLTTQII